MELEHSAAGVGVSALAVGSLIVLGWMHFWNSSLLKSEAADTFIDTGGKSVLSASSQKVSVMVSFDDAAS